MHDDLKAAAEAGLISDAQADAVAEFLARRAQKATTERVAAQPEERFRLLGGFNDIFVSIGVVLLFGAAVFTVGQELANPFSVAGAMAGIALLLGFWLTKHLKLTLPSILLAIAFVASFTIAAGMFYGLAVDRIDWDSFWPWMTLSALVGAVFHYLVFALPFSLGMIAGLAVLAIAGGLECAGVALPDGGHALVYLIGGFFVFLLGVLYDRRDPTREGRIADCAFWLHAVASPLIVHGTMTFLVFGAGTFDWPEAMRVFMLVGVFLLVALLFDRRALLVPSLGYLAVAITLAVDRFEGDETISAVLTMALLGSGTIALGAGWRAVRRLVFALVPGPMRGLFPPLGPAQMTRQAAETT